MSDTGTSSPKTTAAVRRYQPLVPAAVAFILGILAAEYLGGGMLAWCGAAVAAAVVWAALYLLGVREGRLLVPLLVLVAAAGAARYALTVDPPPDDVARLVTDGPRMVVLEGTVVRSVRQSSPPDDVFLPSVPYYVRSNLVLESERVRMNGRWVPASGRVQAVVREAMPPAHGEKSEQDPAKVGPPGNGAEEPARVPDLGDRVQVLGILLPFGQPANPGSFDVAGYLRAQGIRAYVRTDHWQAVRVVEPGADPVRSRIGALQRWAVARLDSLPSEEGRAMASAMLFGRRDLLDFDSGRFHGQSIEHAFLATGTLHYMAVSGFNVAMVAAPILILMRLLGFGRRATALVVAAAVLTFTLMTELEPPVLRAAILFWVLCFGWLIGREPIDVNTLAAAVITVLVVRPGDLFSMSFQLSFLAVLGMIFVVGRLEQSFLGPYLEARRFADPARRPGWWYRRVVRGTLMVSVAATLINMPLIAGKFHVVAWLSPLASALLFPLVFGLTVSGMALVAAGWAAPWLGDLLAAGPDGLGRTIAAVVKALANVPGAYFYVGDVSPAWLILAYVLLAAWVWRGRLGVPRRRLAMAALAASAVFVWTGGHAAPPSTRATFLAVGGGSTILLELPNGRNLLCDAGSVLSHARAAESTIAPALWSRRIDRVDAVFLSHAHFDHFKDILPLVDRFGVRQVFIPPTFMRRRLESDDKVIEALLERNVQVELFGAGDRLAGTGAVEIAAVWPRGTRSMTKAINDGSLALVVADGGRRLLLAGDLQAAGLAALRDAAPDLRADAMLWPHHGHEPGAVGQFAAAVGARTLVVSAGRPFMPVPKPAWLKERGARCFHTGDDGAVTLELRPEGVRAETFAAGAAEPIEEPEAGDEED